jgi:hypothetical protein
MYQATLFRPLLGYNQADIRILNSSEIQLPIGKVKGKGNVQPRTGHEGPEGE